MLLILIDMFLLVNQHTVNCVLGGNFGSASDWLVSVCVQALGSHIYIGESVFLEKGKEL